ncbi:protein SPT2 homolog [Anomaloglossus baeobatrachus]
MDFMNVLKVAASKQSNDGVSKRYSLAVGPPKKDPKVKGVQSAAVQAFLRRKEAEIRKQGITIPKNLCNYISKIVIFIRLHAMISLLCQTFRKGQRELVSYSPAPKIGHCLRLGIQEDLEELQREEEELKRKAKLEKAIKSRKRDSTRFINRHLQPQQCSSQHYH